MALGSTQPLNRNEYQEYFWNIFGGKERLAGRADNLATIYEPIVYRTREPQHLTTLRSSTACYRDTFTFLLFYQMNAKDLISS
jgi:hypothetical protein